MLILHLLEQELKTVKVCTIDSEVVVILVGAFVELTKAQLLADIWIAFGMGKDVRFYTLNAIPPLGIQDHKHLQYSIH